MKRLNLLISEALDERIEKEMLVTDQNKTEIIKKALMLYLAAREGESKGLKLGLVDRQTDQLKTEIVGL